MTGQKPHGLVALLADAIAGGGTDIQATLAQDGSAQARRAALALRIIALRAQPEIPPAPEAPAAVPDPVPETVIPDPAPQEPVAPPPPPVRRIPKTSFSSVSLDDAALLLAATSAHSETITSVPGTPTAEIVAAPDTNATEMPDDVAEPPRPKRQKKGQMPTKESMALASSALAALQASAEEGHTPE